MMDNIFFWSNQPYLRLPLRWALAVAVSGSEDYELSAEEASELIAALGGTSQQRAGYREPLGNQWTQVDRAGKVEKLRAKWLWVKIASPTNTRIFTKLSSSLLFGRGQRYFNGNRLPTGQLPGL